MAGPSPLPLLTLLALTHQATTLQLTDFTGVFLSPNMRGGFERVTDKINSLDDTVNSCFKRQICESMSLGQVIERSDGSLELEKGFLRQAVDSAGDVLFELSRPFLEGFGMGRVARREVSFTEFLVDIMDSAIIGVSRLLGGRTLSRQLEQISPVTELIQTAGSVVTKHYAGSVLDLFVDLTGFADRTTGSYNMFRSAGLGYFLGGGDDSVCQNINGDDFSVAGHCSDEETGKIFPLGMLNPINNNQLGKTATLANGDIHPLMNRGRNSQPTTRVSFDFKMSDMMEPSKILCRVDGIVGAVNGYVAGPPEYPETEESIGDSVRVVGDSDSEVDLTTLPEDQRILVDEWWKRHTEMTNNQEVRSSRERSSDLETFEDYCHNMTKNEISKILKEEHHYKISAMPSQSSPESGGDEELSVVEIRKTEQSDAVDLAEELVSVLRGADGQPGEENQFISRMKTVVRTADRSLLAEKLDVESGRETVETVQSLINTFQLETNGKVEKVLELDSKKGQPVLLIQFDSKDYRDAVLKKSRRSQVSGRKTQARFKKPKVNELKHVWDLVRRRSLLGK